MSKSKEKGSALEYAIRRIEEHILKTDPQLKGAEAIVEQNKIMIVEGVRYEVDVGVTVNRGSHYETFHIIECKNWQDAVGADEIAKLVIKAEQLRASTATLMARNLTKDARNLAKQRDIRVVSVSEDLVPVELVANAHSSKLEAGIVTVHFAELLAGRQPILDFERTECEYLGKQVKLGSVLDPIIESAIRSRINADPRARLSGMHSGSLKVNHKLAHQALRIGGLDVEEVAIDLAYSTVVTSPSASWKIGVEGRGGFLKFEYPPGTFGHENISLEILTKSP